MNDYAADLTALNAEYAPQGEAIWLRYGENPAPTVEDVQTFMETTVALRLEIDEALREIDAPEQIGALHDRWVDWHASLVADEKALAARAAASGSLDEYVQSTEIKGYLDTLQEGKALCAEVEGRLNSTDAQELFADAAWMPSDLTEVVHAAIGCDAFPDNLDDIVATLNP